MADTLRGVLTHPAGWTAVSTAIGYLLILALMTIVIFGGAYAFFTVFG